MAEEGTGGHVLVAGATGLVGRAAMEHLAGGGHRVTAVSRRRPADTYGASHLSVDLDDPGACRAALGSLTDVTSVVFAALYEQPSLAAGWLEDEHVQRNGRMLRNLVDAVAAASPGLRHVTVLQGPKAYGVHVGPIPVPAREDRDERRDIPNFYWVQEDYLREQGPRQGWHWTIFRPSLVVGMAVGGAMNVVAALGAYGALLAERGEPLHYPGGATPVIEATDTELMAAAFAWAATAPEAADQVLNITNGDVFTMRGMWPVIAECLGMEVGEAVPMLLSGELPGRAGEWDAIRARHGLAAPALDAFVAQSFQFADFCLAHGNERVLDPSIISTVKLRQAGFCGAIHTEEMFRKWFARYQREGLLPPV